jgi:hypothetical protein
MSVSYEKRDVRVASIVWGAALITAVTLFAFGLAWLFLGSLVAREQAASTPAHPLAAEVARKVPPAPRLQTSPRDDLLALRERERAALQTYGWVDEQRGIVRIPIERAMSLVAERGLPAREAPR